MKDKINNYDMIFKIIIIGDSNVGKTNILTKYLKNEFDPNSKPTIGVEFATKQFTIKDNIIFYCMGYSRTRKIPYHNKFLLQRSQRMFISL